MLLTSQWIVKMNFWASAHAGMRGNMKRKIAWILLAAMTLSIAACGNKKVDYGMNGGSDDTGNAGGLEGQLDIPDNCDVTFDIGESKLSSITLKDDDIEVKSGLTW